MKISENVSSILNISGVITKDEAELCKYGLDSFIATFIEIATILILSIALNNFVETVLLFLTFIPLRVYAGGYHADTRLTCFIVSLVVYCVFTVLLKVIPIKLHYLFILIDIVTNLLLVILFAPIVHKNKTFYRLLKLFHQSFLLSLYQKWIDGFIYLQ